MKQEKYGYIYKITNNINGKIYVGLHKYNLDKLDESYWGSGKIISRAIQKEGKENFSREILEWCYDRQTLKAREIYWINKLNARNSNIGYNLAPGGDGGDLGEEIRKHQSEVQSGTNHWNYGKNLSEETKRKISESHKGIKHTDECKKRMSQLKKEYYKSHVVSEDTRRKISEGNKNVSPEVNYMRGSSNRGKKFSEEHKYKMSIAIKEAMKNVKYKLICKNCGNQFIENSSSYRYCPDCRKEGFKK